ncbi:MAG: hypothetical protein L3J33_04525 [Rhodobacteraceae bacterium]|nr:hypothetical protein [Paracoccaceae bacterium]
MAKPDKAELKKQGALLKEIIAQARKKTLNFALLQGKDQMFLVTHLKKNPAMLRKEAKKEGGGPKAAMGTLNVEGKSLIFSVEDEPPGPFPKLTKKHFMTRGIPVRVTFKLPNGTVFDDGEAPEAEAQTTQSPPEPEIDEALGASVFGMFSGLQSELEEKMNKAGDDLRGRFQDLSDKFNDSHAGKQFDQAAAYLGDLKKQLSDFVEDVSEDIAEQVSGPITLSPELQKKIDVVIAKGVSELEIQQKSAEENAKLLVKNVLAQVEESKEYFSELLAPATEKISEMIAEYQKYQAAKDQLKDMDLSDKQAKDLAQLSLDHPQSFAAALAALKSMDSKFGDLVATPKGIKDLRAKQQEAKKIAQAAEAVYNAIWDKNDLARDAVAKAKKDAEAAQKKLTTAQQALVKLKAKLPSDLSKLSEVQKKALATVIKILQANKKLLEGANTVLTGKEAEFNITDAEFKVQAGGYGGLEDKQREAAEAIQAAETKKKMLDSLNVGALSPDAKNPMKDEDVAKILAAVEADPEFGNAALDLVASSNDKENVAKGAGMLAKGLGNGFADKNGNTFGADDADRARYAANALKMGNALGADYFDNLQGFVATGGLNKETELSFNLTPVKKLEQERAKYVSGAMLDEIGQLDSQSLKAIEAMNMVNFHPDLLANSTPGMNMHFADMAKTMADPTHAQKIQDVLDGVTTPPVESTGRDLVAQATGKPPGDVTADDIKTAVMSAMFTPLDQGPVGSCFATGPARKVRDSDPAKAMADMAEIATKGTFTTAQGIPIKAVRTNLGTTPADIKKNKLPPNDNPLMRSWEYTVATAGAQLAKSTEEQILDYQLWATGADSGPTGANLNALENLDGMQNWAIVQRDLKDLIHAELDFRYNATSDIKKSADGSSTKGNFEIFNNGGEFPPAGTITSKAAFINIMSSLAIKAAKAETNPELSAKITAHCSSQAFIDSVCLWTKGTGTNPDVIKKPWELSGGGYAAPMVKVLKGGNPATTDVLEENKKPGEAGHKPPGERTKKIMSALLTSFISQDPDTEMVNLTTGGIHAFGGLPNHPSLDKLKEGNNPAAAMEEHLLKPGREMAAKDMETDTAAVLFDRQIDAYIKKKVASGKYLHDDEKGIELIELARAKRPTSGMTPKELKQLVDATLKPIIDYQLKTYADNWKQSETAAGNPPSDEEYTKKLAGYQGWADSVKEETFTNTVINTLGPPEFVIADTNWGSGAGHTYFVIIADPITGEPKMFERSEPDGKLKASGDEWVDTNWRVTK